MNNYCNLAYKFTEQQPSWANTGRYAFSQCKGLSKIVIPDSVTTLGDSAFSWCDNLSDVTIGAGLDTIYRWAFESCNIQSATFVNTDGWSVTSSDEKETVQISEEDLKDKEKAAKLLKDYYNYSWHRSDE